MRKVGFAGLVSVLAAVAVLFTGLLGVTPLAWASSNSLIAANVVVPGSCFISGANSINLGNPLAPDTNYAATVSFTVNDPGGNLPANILVAASGNWMSGATSIFYGNVLWSASSGGSETPLTTTLTNTLIPIAAPNAIVTTTSNDVYFGINVPAAQPVGLYTSNILFQNSCSPSNSVELTVPTTANIVGTCFISLSPTTVNFGSIVPGANVPTNVNVVVSDPGGNFAANVLVDGTNWVSGVNNFGVSNTLWDAANQVSVYAGTPLTNALVITSIIVTAPTLGTPTTSNSIYFGLGIPQGVVAGTYTQNIVIENSC